MLTRDAKITVAGAGAIGLYMAGVLAAAGRQVTALGRPAVVDAITADGLTVGSITASDVHVSSDAVHATTDPVAAFHDSAVVLVCVKSADTAAMARTLAAHAPPSTVVVSLQNGVRNPQVLRAALPGWDVRAGVVPFNVVREAPNRVFRGVAGETLVASGPAAGLAALLTVPGHVALERPNMEAIQWGKLLVNLNNALNALSGMPLKAQLEDARWRALLAASVSEALRVLRAADVKPARYGPLPPSLTPAFLRLPDPLFRLAARKLLQIDPRARSSMAEDLDAGRLTEIDTLQGEIVRLGEAFGVPTPLAEAVVSLMREAEAGQPGVQSDGPAARAQRRVSPERVLVAAGLG